MKPDLKQQVVAGLQARKGHWKAIAEALAPEVSYSFISQLGRNKYGSDPSYAKLKLIAEHLNGQNA